MTKILSIFFLLISFTLISSKASAQTPLTDVPVFDKSVTTAVNSVTAAVNSTTASQNAGNAKDVARFTWKNAFKTVLENIKDTLLRNIVNDTMNWIQNGGQPRFVTDFSGLMRESVDSAVGETVLQIGAAPLCTGLRAKLIVNLPRPPKFNQVTQCTLSQIVGNVNAFARNFNQGGWSAFLALQQPNNSLTGLSLITHDFLLKTREQKENQAKREANVGGGFLGQTVCQKWQNIQTGETRDINDPESNEATHSPDGAYFRGTPNPPVKSDGSISAWKCVIPITVTPGNIIGQQVSKAVGSSIDRIVNAQDLRQYVSAIIDTLINRLTREATGLLSDGFNSLSNNNATAGLRNTMDQLNRANIEQIKSSIKDGLNQLSFLERNITTANNNNSKLINTYQDIITEISVNNKVCDWDLSITQNKLTEAQSRINALQSYDINSYENELNRLLTQINSLDPSSPQVNNELNQISNELNEVINTINKDQINVGEIGAKINSDLFQAVQTLTSCQVPVSSPTSTQP